MSQVLAQIHRLNRVERWLYNGLHSLDFAFWYNSPLWDIGMIALLPGRPGVERHRAAARHSSPATRCGAHGKFVGWRAAGNGAWQVNLWLTTLLNVQLSAVSFQRSWELLIGDRRLWSSRSSVRLQPDCPVRLKADTMYIWLGSSAGVAVRGPRDWPARALPARCRYAGILRPAALPRARARSSGSVSPSPSTAPASARSDVG